MVDRVFIGYDHRQAISYSVLHHSIITRASRPVSITPLVIHQLPINRMGLTPFTFSRFLVPYLCDYKGWALFLDADMLLTDDICKLFDYADDQYTVMVHKHEMRFEWPSVLLYNCDKCQVLTPDYIEQADKLHMLEWVEDKDIGGFPSEWNHLVGYDAPRPDAKLIHYTQGIPAFPETKSCEYAEQWYREHNEINSAEPWVNLMAKSTHAVVYKGRPVPKFLVDEDTKQPKPGKEEALKLLFG